MSGFVVVVKVDVVTVVVVVKVIVVVGVFIDFLGCNTL